MSTLSERVARFIAHFRSVAIESSRKAYENCMSERDENGAFDDEADYAESLLAKLDLAYAEKTEDNFYQELLPQGIAEQIRNVYGVDRVNIAHADGDCILRVWMHIYYPHAGKIYDFGICQFRVGTEYTATEIRESHKFISFVCDFELIALEDGTLSPYDPDHYECTFTCKENNTIYGDVFCFGVLSRDIAKYLVAGDFVSAIQTASLCLHHVNTKDLDNIPMIYREVCAADRGINIQKMAEYFGLSEDEVAKIEARQRELEERKQKRSVN